MSFCLLYITCPDKETATHIARKLVEERLIACANLLGSMESFYWWNDLLEESEEFVLIAKTKEILVREVTDRIKALHPYTCPCIITLPITGGNSDFLTWIDKSLSPTPSS